MGISNTFKGLVLLKTATHNIFHISLRLKMTICLTCHSKIGNTTATITTINTSWKLLNLREERGNNILLQITWIILSSLIQICNISSLNSMVSILKTIKITTEEFDHNNSYNNHNNSNSNNNNNIFLLHLREAWPCAMEESLIEIVLKCACVCVLCKYFDKND